MRGIGLAVDTIKKLFTGEAMLYSGKLNSPEHDRDFNVQDGKLQLYKEKNNPDKLHLSLNGQHILEWFKKQYVKLKQTVRPHIKPAPPKQKNSRGI